MAADFLAILIKTNLAAAAAVVVVLVLRRMTRRAFGARVAYVLWLVVPLAVAAILLPARAVVLPYAAPSEAVTEIAVPAMPAGEIMAVTPPAPLVDDAALVALWLAGVVISFALLAWSQSRFIRSLGGVSREGQFLRARASGAGPAVVGALFPRIVLPADFEARYDSAEQEVVLAHEAAHLAAGDAAVNGAIALAQCLFWFNPLIHISARAIRIDQEFACDAVVLSAYPQTRRVYAGALLKTQLAAAPLPLGCYWPARASNPLKERIAMLSSKGPSRVRRLCGAAGVLGLCLGAGVVAWAAQPATTTVAPAPTDEPGPQAATVARTAVTAAAGTAPGAPSAAHGETYRVIIEDAVPPAPYTLTVARPDGKTETLVSPRPAPPLTGPEVTPAFRQAQLSFAKAKREEAARIARGAPPQRLTPELQSAFKVMTAFEESVQAQRLAKSTPQYVSLSVVWTDSPAGAGSPSRARKGYGLYVPKNLTAASKARTLARLDADIARAPAHTRASLIDLRAALAEIQANSIPAASTPREAASTPPRAESAPPRPTQVQPRPAPLNPAPTIPQAAANARQPTVAATNLTRAPQVQPRLPPPNPVPAAPPTPLTLTPRATGSQAIVVPKPFTADVKAQTLQQVDAWIARLRAEGRPVDQVVKARDDLALTPPVD